MYWNNIRLLLDILLQGELIKNPMQTFIINSLFNNNDYMIYKNKSSNSVYEIISYWQLKTTVVMKNFDTKLYKTTKK